MKQPIEITEIDCWPLRYFRVGTVASLDLGPLHYRRVGRMIRITWGRE